MTKEKEISTQGKSWKVFGKFKTFDEANESRNELKASDEQLEVKVKYMPSSDNFVVKIRKNEEEKAKKKK